MVSSGGNAADAAAAAAAAASGVSRPERFTFDRVFAPDVQQQEVRVSLAAREGVP
jgi:hypothetical protein